MTEKRFTYDKPLVAFSKGGINDNVTGETYEFTMDTVLDLLNALHEENQANDHLLRVYTDFLKEEGYNITDIIDFCQKEILDELTPQLRGDRSIL